MTYDRGTEEFIQLAKRAPRLTRDEEAELLQRWQQKSDRKAMSRLIESNLRDVVFAALKYRHYGVPVGDLICEGNLGLMKALEKYDAKHQTRFATYAAFWIRAHIVGIVMRSWSIAANGSGALHSKLFFKLRRERAKLEMLHGAAADHTALLAERLNMNHEQVEKLLQQLDARDVSIDAERSPGENSRLVDELAAEDDGIEHALIGKEDQKAARELLSKGLCSLNPRERFIVERRLIADGEDEMSLADVGREFGVSRERARQLEQRVKAKLRDQVKPGTTSWELVAA